MVLQINAQNVNPYDISQISNNNEYNEKLKNCKELIGNLTTELDAYLEIWKNELVNFDKNNQDPTVLLNMQNAEVKSKILENRIKILKILKDANYIPETIIDLLLESASLESKIKSGEISRQEADDKVQDINNSLLMEWSGIKELKALTDECKELQIKTLDLTLQMFKYMEEAIKKEKIKLEELYKRSPKLLKK